MVQNCKAAKATTMTSRLGPVAAVTTGILLAIVFSMKYEHAPPVMAEAPGLGAKQATAFSECANIVGARDQEQNNNKIM